MSFYGSVYYQLIDTFYKIIVKNSGDKTYTFNDVPFNPSETPDNEIIESPAVGRKGVFSLNSGNYWINFSKSDDVDEAAPYKIWHSAAHDDPDTSKRISSWDIESDQYTYEKDDKGIETKVLNKDGVEMVAGKDYIQLQDHEFIRMYPSHYDEAGHIIDGQTEPTLYRLPKSDVNEQVNWLMELIGEPSEDKKLPMWEIPEEERGEDEAQNKSNSVMTLSDYAEKNYEDLRTLESFVGKWSDIADNWGADWYMAPTITDFIGQAQKLFNDPDADENDYEEFKRWFKEGWNLTNILGELPKMWRAVNEGGAKTPISFADAFVVLTDKLTAHMNAASDKFDEISLTFKGVGALIDEIEATIGTDVRELGPIYPALNTLQDNLTAESEARRNADTTLQNNLTTEATTREEQDNALSGRINTEKSDREKRDSELFAQINEETSTRIQDVSRLEQDISSKDSALRTLISETKTALQAEIDSDDIALSNALTAAYQAADTALDGKLSQALSDAQNNINKRIDDLSDLHTEHYDSLTEDIETINTVLGSKPNDTTVFARLAKADEDISKLQASLGSTGETTVASQISDLDTKIETVKTGIGSSTDIAGTATVYGAIATNKADIDAVKGAYLQQTTASETYLTKSDASNTYLKKDDAAQTYLVEENVSELRQSVSNLETIIGTVDTTKGQDVATILTQILNEIEGIKGSLDDINDEIDGIKASILENHPVTEPDLNPDESGEEEPGTDPEVTPNE